MELDKIRESIDRVDGELVRLVVERMSIVREVAEYKANHNMQIVDAARERAVLSKVSSAAGEEYELAMKRVFESIMAESRALQRRSIKRSGGLTELVRVAATKSTPLTNRARVAVQGVEGSYGSQACEMFFQFPETMFLRNFAGVVEAVKSGMCDYGVLPIENSLAGAVRDVWDLLDRGGFHICASLCLPIDHALLARHGETIDTIRRVYSHPQALAQCAEYLKAHKGITAVTFENTAAAAQHVAASDEPGAAAIASKKCAKLYDLDIVARDIAMNETNITRFICISKELVIPRGSTKASFIARLPNKPGALHELTSLVASYDINMTKLESKQIPGGNFAYKFLIEVDADPLSEQFSAFIGDLEQNTDSLRFLGAYREI